MGRQVIEDKIKALTAIKEMLDSCPESVFQDELVKLHIDNFDAAKLKFRLVVLGHLEFLQLDVLQQMARNLGVDYYTRRTKKDLIANIIYKRKFYAKT